MLAQLVSFQVQFRGEHNKLLLHASRIRAQEMILPIMLLERRIIAKIRWLTFPPITDKAPLMRFSTMNIKLIFTIESLSAEAALRMPFEAALVNSSWVVIAFSHMSLQFSIGKQFMLVCKDFLVP
jgi:hypothetical protein